MCMCVTCVSIMCMVDVKSSSFLTCTTDDKIWQVSTKSTDHMQHFPQKNDGSVEQRPFTARHHLYQSLQHDRHGSGDLTSAHTVDYYGLKVQTTGISRDTHLHIKQNSEEQKEQEEVLDKAQEGEGEGHGEEGGGGHGGEE